MPKAIYTEAKGLFESADSDSGFSISDAPIILGTQAVELQQIVYELDFSNLENADDGDNNGGPTTAYQNQTFVLFDADATAVTFQFHNDGQTTNAIEANGALGDANIAYSDGDTGTLIADAAETAIAGYDSSSVFSVANNGAGILTVYVKKPGFIGNESLVESQTPLQDIAETEGALLTLSVAAAGGVSRVAGYISQDRGNNKGAPTANQIHGAGLSVITLEQDNTDAALVLAFADGDDVGQEKFIQHAATTGPIILTGNFQKAGATGTELTLAAGSIEWLIWNGSQWYLALDAGTI